MTPRWALAGVWLVATLSASELAVPNALAVEPSAAGRETSRVLAQALGRPGTAAVS
jgi:hypothetical protein